MTLSSPDTPLDAQLLPCPFCGGEAEVHHFASGECIKCANEACGVETALVDDGKSAAIWNARSCGAQQPSGNAGAS